MDEVQARLAGLTLESLRAEATRLGVASAGQAPILRRRIHTAGRQPAAPALTPAAGRGRGRGRSRGRGRGRGREARPPAGYEAQQQEERIAGQTEKTKRRTQERQGGTRTNKLWLARAGVLVAAELSER